MNHVYSWCHLDRLSCVLGWMTDIIRQISSEYFVLLWFCVSVTRTGALLLLTVDIKMTTCLLQNKTFYCREWVFTKLLHCLDSRATAKTCGALVMGGPGCGKTAVCSELVWPTTSSRASSLTQRMLAYYFCQAHDAETLSVANFLHCLADQVSMLLVRCCASFMYVP